MHKDSVGLRFLAPPLEELRIIDLSRLLPGPYCTMLLADLGAEVIKIEEPKLGDYIRRIPPYIGTESALFLSVNRNKKGMTLNLKSEKGREVFYKLAERSDVILESFRPGVTERLGVHYEKIKEINPKIIYCSISGYGKDGPYRDWVGHDVNYTGFGGILGITGERNGPPVVPGVQIADLAGGMFAAISILTALITRGKTSKGQYIDVSMLDGCVSWLTIHAATYFARGKPPKRGEMLLSGGFPCYGIYETKDGKYITLGVLEDWFWRNLCKALGEEDIVDDQFATGDRREDIRSLFKSIFRTKNRDEWVRILNSAGVPCGPVYSMDEVFSDPQVLHRKMLVEIGHPTAGKIKQIGIPMKFSDTPGEIKSPPPLFGQHTEEILQWLGYTKVEIEGMRKSEII